MAALEEADRSRDHMAKTRAHTYHPSVISYPWPFYRVHHNPHRVVHILQWDGSYVVTRSGTHETGWSISIASSNGWDTMGHLQVGRGVGEFVHLISIGSTRWSCLHPQIQIEIQVGRRIVPVSLPQSAVICLLEIKKLKSSNLIQVNNNLQKKMVERTYHKVLSVVVNEQLHLSLAVFTLHVRLHKKLHWAWLTSKSCSL